MSKIVIRLVQRFPYFFDAARYEILKFVATHIMKKKIIKNIKLQYIMNMLPYIILPRWVTILEVYKNNFGGSTD